MIIRDEPTIEAAFRLENGIEVAEGPTVKPLKIVATDNEVLEAMLISTQGEEILNLWEQEGITGIDGRLRFLMRNRHGTPFEHNMFRFYVKAPISVFREFHRHRIGFSYNEQSGRYMELEGQFYVPSRDRPMKQSGKPGHYIMEPIEDEFYEQGMVVMIQSYNESYASYLKLLNLGWAKEVARNVLPVGLYSSMYVTCNARSLMSFLGLRTEHERAQFPSKPMFEIQQVAAAMEASLAVAMPITYQAFNDFGRVAP